MSQICVNIISTVSIVDPLALNRERDLCIEIVDPLALNRERDLCIKIVEV